MKTMLVNSMVSFTLGTGATLVSLYSWLGTSDLEAIKQSVQNYIIESEQHVSQLLGEYNVTVDNANAEIGDYQVALKQANDNINTLITAYEQAEQKYEQDLADLEQALQGMGQRLDFQYEQDMNAKIQEANEQINNANTEVADTRTKVDEYISTSQVDEIVNGDKHQLDTTGSKEVTDISSVVPQE